MKKIETRLDLPGREETWNVEITIDNGVLTIETEKLPEEIADFYESLIENRLMGISFYLNPGLPLIKGEHGG